MSIFYSKTMSGAPNKGMFRITSEVSQWFSLGFKSLFGSLGAAPKTICFTGCRSGT